MLLRAPAPRLSGCKWGRDTNKAPSMHLFPPSFRLKEPQAKTRFLNTILVSYLGVGL